MSTTTFPIPDIKSPGIRKNLRLDGVVPGRYELLAQPLAVHGADAAPVRAMLRTR